MGEVKNNRALPLEPLAYEAVHSSRKLSKRLLPRRYPIRQPPQRHPEHLLRQRPVDPRRVWSWGGGADGIRAAEWSAEGATDGRKPIRAQGSRSEPEVRMGFEPTYDGFAISLKPRHRRPSGCTGLQREGFRWPPRCNGSRSSTARGAVYQGIYTKPWFAGTRITRLPRTPLCPGRSQAKSPRLAAPSLPPRTCPADQNPPMHLLAHRTP